MTKLKIILLTFIILNCHFTFAQNIKDEDVEYNYIKLPLNPLPGSIKNYQSSIFANYEEENKIKKAKYEAEKKIADDNYDKEKAVYPSKVKAAEDKFNREMEEWKKKSLGEKVLEKQVLGENNKPVKQIPSPPYPISVQLPDLKTSYDYPVVAKTYLILDGFTDKPDNAVKIDVILYGYDYTEPRQLSEQKTVASYANGQTQSNNVTYYHNEFSYRHTMSVKVTTPEGKELFNISPQELNTYKIYKSPETATPAPFNPQMLVKTYEEKILQENLIIINNIVNDKIGYKRVKRKIELSFVKSKDETYQDLLIAYNDASAGLKILIDDEINAKKKIDNAIELWNKALLESDIKNKKARIDKDVTLAIYFNLLECYFANKDISNLEKVIASLNTMDLSSSKRKLKEQYEELNNDLKKRISNNK